MKNISRKLGISSIVIIVIALATVLIYQQTAKNVSRGSQILVAASFYPLADFVLNVGGDKVSVLNMTPAGAEPHDYEPSPKELVEAHKAKMFVYNGNSMEPWGVGFLSDFSGEVVLASKGISEGELRLGPHYWLDPVLAEEIVINIRDGLIRIDPASEHYFREKAEAYIRNLKSLDEDFKTSLTNCKVETIVSTHSAMDYIAKRYGFRVESVVGYDPDEEPSVARIAEIIEFIKAHNVKYIFYESQTNTRLADTISAEAGIGTLEFNPVESLTQKDQDKGKDYLSIQYDNLNNIRRALSCQ